MIFKIDFWSGISHPASFYPANLLHYWKMAAIDINSNNIQNSVLFFLLRVYFAVTGNL